MLLPAQIGMCILAVCILAEYIKQDLEGSVCFATFKPEAASKWVVQHMVWGKKKPKASAKAEPSGRLPYLQGAVALHIPQ